VTVSEAGQRVVPGREPPSLTAPGRKVLLFGGSTTFGMGVDDRETIPAYLQEALDNTGIRATVYNMGVVAYHSTQERVLFERLLNQGVRPDVAVFIDGLNDFAFCDVPDRTEMSNLLAGVGKDRTRVSLAAELAERSNVIKLIRYYTQGKAFWPTPGEACRDDAGVEAVIRRLDSNRRMIAAVARQFGVTPLFVQQPVPTYAYDNGRRAVPLPSLEALTYHRNSAVGYPRMRGMRDQGRLWTENVLWLEEMSIPGSMYVDTVHYSPAFHRAMAGRIFQELQSLKVFEEK
ncbi:MAG: SGNH/GDSL hydrolase family protein, partial [Alphaproteobacteria bacterium]